MKQYDDKQNETEIFKKPSALLLSKPVNVINEEEEEYE